MSALDSLRPWRRHSWLSFFVELNRFAEKDLSGAFRMDTGPHPWKIAGVRCLLGLWQSKLWQSSNTFVHNHLDTFPYMYVVGSAQFNRSVSAMPSHDL